MRINRISLNNFRIYKGQNSIAFKANSKNKNITVIAGQNGFGKTTFLTALVWGFYGKLISEVDEKYKREIYELGGYKKYAQSILNREIKLEADASHVFSVEIEIADVYIPSVPCRKIVIRREYDLDTESENIKVLIDGFENELTKEVGSDIFINDFLLPREIAKFFLFDAEKIVSLAEIKTVAEKRNLSLAYSEVLGISKYVNLKRTLENLRVKLRKKSASISDRKKLSKHQEEAQKLEKLIAHNEAKIASNADDIEKARNESEQYQEKLIREGNSMTVEDLVNQKKVRDSLRQSNIEIKSKLKELLELAPFAIAGNKLVELNNQVKLESQSKQSQFDNEFIESKLKNIKQHIEKQLKKKKIPNNIKGDISALLEDAFESNLEEQNSTLEKVLLDLSPQQSNEFFTLFNNLKQSYSILFKQIVKEERNNRIFLAKTLKKISNAESKDTDILAKKYKTEKAKVDKRISELSGEQNKLYEELGAYQQELATKTKLISELAKTVSLDEMDEKKDVATSRLIEELSEFILKFKSEKKYSLQNRIKRELHRLMHKENFIEDVSVELVEDIIEINLLDRKGNLIEKDTLSKGEQQLYATALLKSLVDESGIQFPIFIDSPLQKFDKRHSKNIITEFYPAISKQVILFPLLEKELTEKEYLMLTPFISQTFVIENRKEKSSIIECASTQLFNLMEKNGNVHTH
ncbi:DNA sulfur modification protein DndD [uncultured Draconibacterium sp.]|uniref:DNA sulfur modification protein DndD n=1 Tax=uncultured Draconibacterium sp. TaxID=1573823 RepID=UPI003216CF3B